GNGLPEVANAWLLPVQSEMRWGPLSEHQGRAGTDCRISDTDVVCGRAESYLLLHHALLTTYLASIFTCDEASCNYAVPIRATAAELSWRLADARARRRQTPRGASRQDSAPRLKTGDMDFSPHSGWSPSKG